MFELFQKWATDEVVTTVTTPVTTGENPKRQKTNDVTTVTTVTTKTDKARKNSGDQSRDALDPEIAPDITKKVVTPVTVVTESVTDSELSDLACHEVVTTPPEEVVTPVTAEESDDALDELVKWFDRAEEFDKFRPWLLRIWPDDIPPSAPSGPPIDAGGTWDLLSDYDAIVDVDADCLSLTAPKALPEALTRLCRIHVQDLIQRVWLETPLAEMKRRDAILKMHSEEFGDFYLVSNPSARRLLPHPSALHYTAAEADRVLEMAKLDKNLNGIRVLHGLKKEFGGRMVEPKKRTAQPPGRPNTNQITK